MANKLKKDTCLERIQQLVKYKNNAYFERDLLLSLLSKLFLSYLARHDEADKNWDDDYRWIVFIESPEGQMSWHIHDSELYLFKHLKEQANKWDGHSTEEKYKRLQMIDFHQYLEFILRTINIAELPILFQTKVVNHFLEDNTEKKLVSLHNDQLEMKKLLHAIVEEKKED